METLILVVFFIVVAAALWFTGFWSSLISTVNIILAACFASAFFEPVADQLEYSSGAMSKSYAYLWDVIALWLLFFVAALVIRSLTESFSSVRLRFDPITENVGRSIMSCTAAWFFICFLHFTMMTAPLPPNGNATAGTLVSPDRVWLGFIQSRSRGALSEYREMPLVQAYTQPYKLLPGVAPHPSDANLDARVFDPRGLMPLKYQQRRERFGELPMPRVNR